MSTFLHALRTDPAPLGVWMVACVGNVGASGTFALSARGGLGYRRSYTHSGPIPLRFGGGAPDGSGEVGRSECPNGAPHTSPG